jgi:hypothetical protein
MWCFIEAEKTDIAPILGLLATTQDGAVFHIFNSRQRLLLPSRPPSATRLAEVGLEYIGPLI